MANEFVPPTKWDFSTGSSSLPQLGGWSQVGTLGDKYQRIRNANGEEAIFDPSSGNFNYLPGTTLPDRMGAGAAYDAPALAGTGQAQMGALLGAQQGASLPAQFQPVAQMYGGKPTQQPAPFWGPQSAPDPASAFAPQLNVQPAQQQTGGLLSRPKADGTPKQGMLNSQPMNSFFGRYWGR